MEMTASKMKLLIYVTSALLIAAVSAALLNAQVPAESGQFPTPVAQSLAGVPGPKLTLSDAEKLALAHNPNISVARLLALAQAQVTREVRSAELPTATGNLTAVTAHDNSRITAGLLNNPTVFERAAGGLTVNQLVTDFGRTHHLVQSAQASAKAQLENARATEQDVTLTVDEAFYQALTSQAVLQVARQTVADRQATVDQVSALTKAKLRSDLDLSFANVQLAQARLLMLDAQNNANVAMASLNTVLGSEQNVQYTLIDETAANPESPPQDADALLQGAYGARPDLSALNLQFTSAKQFSTAERDLWMPTFSAMAAAGGTPVRADQIQSNWYGAVGANISVPVFNGFLFNARAREAKLRANAAGEQVRNMRDEIARDVRTAVLNAQNAFQRIAVTQEMLKESNMALDLSQERYKIGLSGIVELTQAQLAQTQAQIAYTNARYAYQTALAVLRFQLGQ
jgi:outer membrane protein